MRYTNGNAYGDTNTNFNSNPNSNAYGYSESDAAVAPKSISSSDRAMTE
jgi:hypothetical protein